MGAGVRDAFPSPMCVWFYLLVDENGAHEPTPSVLYFCQPRVADERRLPWVKSWRGTYAIGIVLFKINFRMRKSFAKIHSPRMVRMCDEKKYNPQWGSLLPYIITQGRLRYTCQPCAIESITPMGYGHTVWFGAIECAIGWGMETPCGWRGLSNVQCDEVRALRVVWWGLVGAVPMCPPVSPCKGASIVHPRAQCVYFWHGNVAARAFGWAHRHRPYGFVWVDCVFLGGVCWENGAHEPTPSVLYF